MISDRRQLDELRKERRVQFGGVCPSYKLGTWVPEKYLLIDTETGDRWEFRLEPSGSIRPVRSREEST